METRKKNKHAEIQFIADEDVGKEIVSMKDTKVKNIGTNINTCFGNVYSLTFIECNVSCKPINETKIIFARDLQVIKL
jgi:hypothetical protein